MIRAGRGGAYPADWLDRKVIGIGRDFDGVDIANMSREQIRKARQTRLPAGPRSYRSLNPRLPNRRALSEFLGERFVRTRSGNDVLDPDVAAVRRGVVRIVKRYANTGASQDGERAGQGCPLVAVLE